MNTKTHETLRQVENQQNNSNSPNEKYEGTRSTMETIDPVTQQAIDASSRVINTHLNKLEIKRNTNDVSDVSKSISARDDNIPEISTGSKCIESMKNDEIGISDEQRVESTTVNLSTSLECCGAENKSIDLIKSESDDYLNDQQSDNHDPFENKGLSLKTANYQSIQS